MSCRPMFVGDRNDEMVLVSGTAFPMVIVVDAPVMIPLLEEFPYLETFFEKKY